jgi:F-type H+-transporting ATPase subunit 8
MPQLIPFYFLHIIFFGIIALSTLIYLSCRFILPAIIKLYLSRVIITKL